MNMNIMAMKFGTRFFPKNRYINRFIEKERKKVDNVYNCRAENIETEMEILDHLFFLGDDDLGYRVSKWPIGTSFNCRKKDLEPAVNGIPKDDLELISEDVLIKYLEAVNKFYCFMREYNYKPEKNL